jgi:hypothetical protein
MTETARMETTFARPSASGAKHNGIIVGLSKPASATPIASDIISTVVTIKTLRKLRTPNFSNTLSAPGGPSDRSEDLAPLAYCFRRAPLSVSVDHGSSKGTHRSAAPFTWDDPH